MRKLLFLIPVCLLSANLLFSQDDDLPPPSSKPKTDAPNQNVQTPPDANDFQGFKPKKKVDLSNFIIEPNFNFSIGNGYIDLGLSPYVGYKIFEPEKSREKGSNTGLFAGGGITYRFTQVSVQTDPAYTPVYSGKGSYNTYGGGVFLQYNIWKGLFARTKFELLHLSGDDIIQGAPYSQNGSYNLEFPKLNKTLPAILVGAGYNLLRSKNFFMPVLISYDLLHSVVDKQYTLYPHGVVVQLGFINIF